MPADIPGYYYDSQKNRYFPIKGPIPGASKRPALSSDALPQKPPVNPNQGDMRTVELLRERELCGNVVTYRKRKVNVQEQFCKRRASQPMVWKYSEVNKICGAVLEHMHLSRLTSEGEAKVDVIITGCSSGTLSLLEVEQAGSCIDDGVKCIPESAVPHNMEGYPPTCRAPLLNRMSSRPEIVCMPSAVSSLKRLGKDSYGDDPVTQKALLTTTGSERSPGSVYLLNFCDAVLQRMHAVASFDYTVWTADCAPNGCDSVIGTNLGARLVNLETGQSSWICRSKSDVLSQQFDLSGNIILCGLRNGAILSLDIRQKDGSGVRLDRHKISYPISKVHRHSGHTFQKRNWFEIKGNVDISSTIFMPSSISSLVFLRSYDQYFLASSMDGSINLYDRRMNKKGEVQSYAGHVNSHTRIQLAVDPSETFLMSGGEDSYMRIWDIKGGELLYAASFMSAVPSTLCWPVSGITTEYQCRSSSGAWVGSEEGIYLMLWP
uniref:Transducin/WD40 repeat-like superfamily protein n=1 Tax=Kalanchoe fedtschenkoi TaxID=63787 RepID=A0A7N0U7Z8_KALFE